jgi:hypothetical protein
MQFQSFDNKKYHIWNTDITHLKTSPFNADLQQSFQDQTINYPAIEKVGNGTSLYPNDFIKIPSFELIDNFIRSQIKEQLIKLQVPLYYAQKKLVMKRCWANRIFHDAAGNIHVHKDSLVFLLYYTVPENSSDLIMLTSKHTDKMYKSADLVDDKDKLHIKVTEGMCILHDGNILHAVSPHLSTLPRDVIVFEFESIFH